MKNILFIGTNNFASSILEKLIEKNIDIKYVVTKPDNKMNRGQKLNSYPVKIIAEKYKIKYITENNINTKKFSNFIKKVMPNLIIIVEYGKKITDELIKIPKHGIINIHPSILPDLRGPTPIQTAILNGYKKTGVSIIKINSKIDSGDILNISICKINNKDTYLSLFKKLINLSVKCLLITLNDIKNNNIKIIKQDDNNATYTKKLNKNLFKINWNKKSIEIERQIKALTGIKFPFTSINEHIMKIINGTSVKKIHNYKPGIITKINKKSIDIATLDGVLRINNVQFQGKKINSVKDILNSKKDLFKIGSKFE